MPRANPFEKGNEEQGVRTLCRIVFLALNPDCVRKLCISVLHVWEKVLFGETRTIPERLPHSQTHILSTTCLSTWFGKGQRGLLLGASLKAILSAEVVRHLASCS
jgi:hypothetical protein